MSKEKYLILPGCDDSNRGDQALIWETVELARTAGYNGDYYMLADNENCIQSKKKKIRNVEPILIHPSEHFKNNKNTTYSLMLKLKWAFVSVLDFVIAEPLVHHKVRKIVLPFYPRRVKKRIAVFQQARAAFVKGGGFLHAYGGITDTYKIYYFLYHIRLAESFGIPVYVLPNSFGPFNAPFVAKMIKMVLKKCKCIMAREEISKNTLVNECALSVFKYSDLAFYLKRDEHFNAVEYLRKRNVPVYEKECVGITMRPYRFDGMVDGEKRYQKYIQSLTECIDWLNQQGYFPVLIEHVYSTLEHENDMSCIKSVVNKLNKSCEYSVFSDRSLNCEQLKSIYGCMNYLIGTRFHSVIFSLAQEVPCIAITYGGNKGKGIMSDMELSRYAIPISDISGKALIDRFQELIKEKEEVKKRITKNLLKIEKEKKEIIEHLRRR